MSNTSRLNESLKFDLTNEIKRDVWLLLRFGNSEMYIVLKGRRHAVSLYERGLSQMG